MKKLLIIITILLVSFFSKAQQQELIENTWYLEKLVNENHSGPIFPPESDEFNAITLNFVTEGETTYFHTGVCAVIEATITSFVEGDPAGAIYYDNYTCCGEDSCTNTDNADFESEYASFFMGEEYISYSITENSDGSLTLNLGNGIFSNLIFTNQNLSTTEVSDLNEHNFRLAFQNNDLIIQSSKSTAKSISMYDLAGKSVLNTNVPVSQKVNTRGLANGIYIVKIIDEKGNTFSKKIRKE